MSGLQSTTTSHINPQLIKTIKISIFAINKMCEKLANLQNRKRVKNTTKHNIFIIAILFPMQAC